MAFNETIVTGRKFRKLIDIVNKTWQRISFWTHSSDVEFTDGKTAETKVGAIDGITDSLASNSSRIAASAKAVNSLSNDLAQQPEWVYDSTGKITGYKTQEGGAGTVFPFSSLQIDTINFSRHIPQSAIISVTVKFNKTFKDIPEVGAKITGGNDVGVTYILNVTKSSCTVYLRNYNGSDAAGRTGDVQLIVVGETLI